MTRACAACGNDRDLEVLSLGYVFCPVCAAVTKPVLIPVKA